MMRALYTSASGMFAQELNVDMISNNLANVNTTGYRRSRINFQDVIYQTMRSPGTAITANLTSPTGVQCGLGVRPAAIEKMFNQGNFERTDNPLDLVIEGDGFFQLATPEGGVSYTRDGSFKIDSTGRLVNADGYPLIPDIVIPVDAVSVSVGLDGTVSVIYKNQAQPQIVGQITIARFVNPAGLFSVGRTQFEETAASGPALVGVPATQGYGKIAQGYLEMANVKVVEEMVNMIVAQRAYEVNSRGIRTSDEMLQEAVNLKR